MNQYDDNPFGPQPDPGHPTDSTPKPGFQTEDRPAASDIPPFNPPHIDVQPTASATPAGSAGPDPIDDNPMDDNPFAESLLPDPPADPNPNPTTSSTRSAAPSSAAFDRSSPPPPNPDRIDALLADLTEPQQKAVTHTEGPVLVLAAAGSGKTRVITRRAAYLVLGCGIAPWNVLSITFTNKAAGEMRERIGSLVSEKQARALTIGTFHALCSRLLREYGELAGIKPDFTIFDMADQKRAMKQVFKDLDISTSHFTPEAILSAVSNAKNQLQDAAQYAATATDFYTKNVARIYHAYTEALDRSNALDFDDLLMRTARMLQRSHEVRTALQERFAYIQIDEYQDTNQAQYVIAHTLAAHHKNLFVVGDPDQSIYGWRGADLRNILDFKKHYPAATVIELGQNYRSTPQILELADTLIRKNRKRIHKPLFTENPPADKPRLYITSDEEQEADEVIAFLRKRQNEGASWSQMAVMYRVNSLSRVMEDALLRSSIPYIVARGTAFYQRKEVKDALAYMRVIASPSDEVSLLRIINTPTRGIGAATIEHLRANAIATGTTVDEALQRCAPDSGLGARAVTAVSKFNKIVNTWRKKVVDADATALGYTPGVRDIVEMIIRDSGLEAFYKADKTGDEEKLANLYELVTAAQRFDDEYGEEDATLHRRLLDYLESVALVADSDAIDPDTGAVTLLTMHAAKGLEFDAVAIIGIEEGLLPHSRALESPDELEEERRLLFVGITRAEKHLMLSHAKYRTMRGMKNRTIASQFFRDFGTDLIETTDIAGDGFEYEEEDISEAGRNNRAGWGKRWNPGASSPASPSQRSQGAEPRYTPRQTGATGSHNLPYDVGSMVRHPQFGTGKVVALTPASNPTRAKITFPAAGTKTLVLEYARLELVN